MSAIKPLAVPYVAWMTLFSSTNGAIGGWVKRHPPYDAARRCGAWAKREVAMTGWKDRDGH